MRLVGLLSLLGVAAGTAESSSGDFDSSSSSAPSGYPAGMGPTSSQGSDAHGSGSHGPDPIAMQMCMFAPMSEDVKELFRITNDLYTGRLKTEEVDWTRHYMSGAVTQFQYMAEHCSQVCPKTDFPDER
tara:strand:+ start:106 stop:492 length:387 start_codon:yes stop_codon:yes gene_type:complete